MTTTVDGRPVCGTCGDEWIAGHKPKTPAEYETAARAEGWRIHRGKTYGGQAYDDALCPRCGRPDPKTVRLCDELAASTQRGDA